MGWTFSSQYCFCARQSNIKSLLLEVVQTSVTVFMMFQASQCLCKFSLEQPLWFWGPSFKSTTIFGPIHFIKRDCNKICSSTKHTDQATTTCANNKHIISDDNYCFCFIIFSLIQLHFVYSLEHSVSFAVWFSKLFCCLYMTVNCNTLFYFIQQNIKLKIL
jgi:hypothetical protein